MIYKYITVKPHLWYRDSLWWCWDCLRVESGITPEEAYHRAISYRRR